MSIIKNILIIVILATILATVSSCNQIAPTCPAGTQAEQVMTSDGRIVWDCVPVAQCNTCGPNTVPGPIPNTDGITTPITSGYLYAPGQANVVAFRRDANGALVVVRTQGGNIITSPTIWGVQLFDQFGNAIGWALLHNGSAAVGANQKVKDYFSRTFYSGPLYVTVEVNVNGDAFGELANGTKMFYQITAIPELGV